MEDLEEFIKECKKANSIDSDLIEWDELKNYFKKSKEREDSKTLYKIEYLSIE